MLVSGRGLFLLGNTDKTVKNFRQVFCVVAETDTAPPHVLPHTILHRAIAQTVAYIGL